MSIFAGNTQLYFNCEVSAKPAWHHLVHITSPIHLIGQVIQFKTQTENLCIIARYRIYYGIGWNIKFAGLAGLTNVGLAVVIAADTK
jgi:hypothetical protein